MGIVFDNSTRYSVNVMVARNPQVPASSVSVAPWSSATAHPKLDRHDAQTIDRCPRLVLAAMSLLPRTADKKAGSANDAIRLGQSFRQLDMF
jgi:hypothetical protein